MCAVGRVWEYFIPHIVPTAFKMNFHLKIVQEMSWLNISMICASAAASVGILQLLRCVGLYARCRKGRLPPKNGIGDDLLAGFYFPFFTVLFYYGGQMNSVLCTVSWFFGWCSSLFYVILRDRMSKNLSWKGYVSHMLERFFTLFLRCRYFIRQSFQTFRTPLIVALVVAVVIVTAVNLTHLANCTVWLAVLVLLLLIVLHFPAALYSCRALFLALAAFLTVSLGTMLLIVNGMGSFTDAYIGGLLILLLLWMLIGGLADYEVAKMSSEIMNTITTLAVLVINVLTGWLGIDAKLQFAVNVAVLPLVAAGYLTAILKEMQAYWEKRYLEKIQPKYKGRLYPVLQPFQQKDEDSIDR